MKHKTGAPVTTGDLVPAVGGSAFGGTLCLGDFEITYAVEFLRGRKRLELGVG